jgi:hypothetical protein
MPSPSLCVYRPQAFAALDQNHQSAAFAHSNALLTSAPPTASNLVDQSVQFSASHGHSPTVLDVSEAIGASHQLLASVNFPATGTFPPSPTFAPTDTFAHPGTFAASQVFSASVAFTSSGQFNASQKLATGVPVGGNAVRESSGVVAGVAGVFEKLPVFEKNVSESRPTKELYNLQLSVRRSESDGRDSEFSGDDLTVTFSVTGYPISDGLLLVRCALVPRLL